MKELFNAVLEQNFSTEGRKTFETVAMTNAILKDARQRLLTDLTEIQDAKHENFAVVPLSKNNLFVWHINVVPLKGDLGGHIFHLTMTFEHTFPDKPPQVEIMAPFITPEVAMLNGKHILSLDILQPDGWQSSRTSLEVLQRIVEFLSAYTGTSDHIHQVIEYTKAYKCKLSNHTYEIPNPLPKCIPKPQKKEDSQTYVNNPSSDWQVAKATHGVGWGKVFFEARLDKVIKASARKGVHAYIEDSSSICSCRFGWATASTVETSVSGIFYGNGKNSHIIVREKNKIAFFNELDERESFHESDIICAGLDLDENKVWFARNGQLVGKKSYDLAPFLQNQELVPVVGLQNSAVQLNFGKPQCAVLKVSGFMTIKEYKATTKTDYLWKMGREFLGWDRLFKGEHQRRENMKRKISVEIFSFLGEADLMTCQLVCKDWRQEIEDSYLRHRAKLKCCFSRCPFGECVLGLGMVIKFSTGGKHIESVRSGIEYFSWNAWDKRCARVGPAKIEYTHFFPLIINDEHAPRALRVFKQCFTNFLPNENFSPEGALSVMTALMNGAILPLIHGGNEPDNVVISQQLQLYSHLQHMLLYVNHHFKNQISHVANKGVEQVIQKDSTFLHKDLVPDVGKFIMSLAVSKYDWKKVRKPVILEIFDRHVPKYMEKYPELDNPDQPDPYRLNKVMDCLSYESRTAVIQAWFTVNINTRAQLARRTLQQEIELCNSRFGCPLKQAEKDLVKGVTLAYDANDWDKFFQGLYLKPQSNEFIQNILNETRERALQKKYYTSRPLNPPKPAPPDPQVPPPAVSVQQLNQQNKPRKCENFEQLVPCLATSLEGVEPLPLQNEVLPLISSGTLQLMVVSPLGSGKSTLAAITAVNTLLTSPQRSLVVVIVPEKNQAVHFEEILSDIYITVPMEELDGHRKLPVRVLPCVAKAPYPKNPDFRDRCILVGTPGRLSETLNMDIVQERKKHIRAVYILETDAILANAKHRESMYNCFLNFGEDIQTIIFSATKTEFVKESLGLILSQECIEGSLPREQSSSEQKFNHWFAACIHEVKKMDFLELFHSTMKFEQCVVFVNDRSRVELFYQHLSKSEKSDEVGMLSRAMHSDERREQVLNFNNRKTKILITEDMPLYGLKTDKVTVVLHVDTPRGKPRNTHAKFPLQTNDRAIDAYERRLENFKQNEHAIHSICFSFQNTGCVELLTEIKNRHGIEELPADPNSISHPSQAAAP